MARTKRGKRTSYGNGFACLHWWLLDSPAYLSLSCNARAALVECYRRYNGSNNGYIVFSVREMAIRLGRSEGTAHRAIKDLQERGFIRPRVMGAFSMKNRHATEWILTEHEYANQPASKEFMRWTAEKSC